MEGTAGNLESARTLGAEAGRLSLAPSLNPFPDFTPEYDAWEQTRHRIVWETLMRNAPAPRTSMCDEHFDERSRDGEYSDPRDTLISEEAGLQRVAE